MSDIDRVAPILITMCKCRPPRHSFSNIPAKPPMPPHRHVRPFSFEAIYGHFLSHSLILACTQHPDMPILKQRCAVMMGLPFSAKQQGCRVRTLCTPQMAAAERVYFPPGSLLVCVSWAFAAMGEFSSGLVLLPCPLRHCSLALPSLHSPFRPISHIFRPI